MNHYDQLIGQVIEGKYTLLEKIGEGGMACVFRGQHLLMQREVAIKLMLPQFSSDPQFIERFQREARLLSRLRSPHIVTIYDFGQTQDGVFYLVMDFVKGKSLSKSLEEQGAFSLETALRYTRQIASALQTAHREEIIHRDLKPENIVLSASSDAGEMVRVLDFGIARMLAEEPDMQRLTATGGIIGTPAYMSPEQFGMTGPDDKPLKTDVRSDIYALGIILYQMLTGTLPFKGASLVDFLQLHTTHPPPPLDSRFSPEVQHFISVALAKDPSQRFQSADEVIRTIDEILGVHGVSAESGGEALTALRRRARSNRSTSLRFALACAVGGAIFLGIAAGIVRQTYENSNGRLLQKLASKDPVEEHPARFALYQRARSGRTDLIPGLEKTASENSHSLSARFHAIKMLEDLNQKDHARDLAKEIVRTSKDPNCSKLFPLVE